MNPKKISISDFSYPLPEEKIAYHPMHPRDSSKILISKNGEIREDIYRFMAGYLPENACLVFNDTRVIRSRIFFPKKTGAVIEIFCLEPYGDFTDYESFFSKTGSVLWKCMIGKAGKWKDQYLTKTILVDNREVQVRAELTERLPDAYIVKLSWSPEEISHGEIIAQTGVTPLPPYIKRTAEKQDENDYQTIYSEHDGSVAAPTAGLHFTAHLLADLRTRSIPTLFTTLHVGAGTFKPVTSDTMEDHLMHEEWMDISLEFLIQLSDQIQKDIVSVGTTACRTLESIYWMGNKILNKPDIGFDELKISQWEVYDTGKLERGFFIDSRE